MITILQLIGCVGLLASVFFFAVEASEISMGQVLLCVFVPFYVFYFAYIKSSRESVYRLILLGGMALILFPPGFSAVFSHLSS